jgi:dTMP kinase
LSTSVVSRALFIVFEGVDGSGTTTQSELLVQHTLAMGHPALYVREPGGTSIGERIRDLVLDPAEEEMTDVTELLLYAASRSQHVEQVIRPALAEGKPVISDRYADSTLAYQGYGRGLDLAVVGMVNELAIAGCSPDMTVYLDLSTEEAAMRRSRRAGASDRLEEAGEELQERVRQGYRQISEQHPESSLLLDATTGVQQQSDFIRKELARRWPSFPFKR